MTECRTLRGVDLPDDPIRLFTAWRQEAIAGGEPEPDAVALATIDPEGTPAVRFVLVRGFDSAGIRLYTDRRSRKGQGLAAHPHAALAVHWQLLERQVRIEGPVELLADAESDAYWSGRPRASQISTHASAQGRHLASRAQLELARSQVAERYPGDVPIPRPAWWGGYLLRPTAWEFWQGRPGRAHDRFGFFRHGDGWNRVRISP